MSDSSRHAEFVELLARHRGPLFGYIYALLRNLNDAEDVYQDTALVLWSKFDDYAPDTHFVRWACVVAKNCVATFLRQKHRHRRYFSAEFQEELALLQADLAASEAEPSHEALVDCMQKLPSNDRSLIDVCYGGDRSFKDAAAQLGRSAQSVYDSLSRIRRQLLDCIDRSIAQADHPRSQEDRP
jgi:RNA polymerase sigma-70 factor (ECF subfamily)